MLISAIYLNRNPMMAKKWYLFFNEAFLLTINIYTKQYTVHKQRTIFKNEYAHVRQSRREKTSLDSGILPR